MSKRADSELIAFFSDYGKPLPRTALSFPMPQGSLSTIVDRSRDSWRDPNNAYEHDEGGDRPPKNDVQQLKAKYAEVFGDETRTGNKAWLVKRIAWRLQANHEGGLTERAHQRARELTCDADLRLSAPRMRPQPVSVPAAPPQPITLREDSRLPLPGTILVREYKGCSVQVRVLEQGFEYAGQRSRRNPVADRTGGPDGSATRSIRSHLSTLTAA